MLAAGGEILSRRSGEWEMQSQEGKSARTLPRGRFLGPETDHGFNSESTLFVRFDLGRCADDARCEGGRDAVDKLYHDATVVDRSK